MKEKKEKYSQLKRLVDIASAIFIAYMFACYVYALKPEELHTDSLPFWLVLVVADIVPTIFGITWLAYRYGNAMFQRYPFINNKWIVVLLVVVAFSLRTFIETMWRVL